MTRFFALLLATGLLSFASAADQIQVISCPEDATCINNVIIYSNGTTVTQTGPSPTFTIPPINWGGSGSSSQGIVIGASDPSAAALASSILASASSVVASASAAAASAASAGIPIVINPSGDAGTTIIVSASATAASAVSPVVASASSVMASASSVAASAASAAATARPSSGASAIGLTFGGGIVGAAGVALGLML